jgi:hypothetical protein
MHTTSDAADMNNTRRGFRYVIFDVFGTVLERPKLDEMFRTHDQARKAMWAVLNAIDAKAITLAAIESAERNYASELQRLRETVNALAAKEAA